MSLAIAIRWRCLALSLLLFLTLAATIAQTQTPPAKSQLRVALFPYIPDAASDNHAAMLARIEREFESRNSSIDLILKPLDKNDDFYDSAKMTQWLTDDPAAGGYHLVEIDTVVLGELVASNAVAAWAAPPGQTDWHAAGRAGVSLNGKTYGVPHWLCGHFTFSRDKRVTKAKSATALVAALERANSNVPNLTGNLLGSWNLPALYLDAWVDTNGAEGISSAISPTLDAGVMRFFKSVSKQYETGGKNPCIDGTFDDDNNDAGAREFAAGRSDAFLGYSERLNYILQQGADPRSIRIASAALGEGKRPVLFIDAFALRKDCDAACQDAAAKFAAYMNEAATYEWILLSRDASKNVAPRYLLPATDSAFRAPGVRQDKYYKALRKEIKNGVPYPSVGLPAIRKQMRDAILVELKK